MTVTHDHPDNQDVIELQHRLIKICYGNDFETIINALVGTIADMIAKVVPAESVDEVVDAYILDIKTMAARIIVNPQGPVNH